MGIALEDQQVAHVHDRLRIDLFDHFGLFDTERGNYLYRLRLIKRLLPDMPAEEGQEQAGARQLRALGEGQQVLF